jgi:16S rRNA (cytidine1402-2'-O)-methyltransferase
MGTLYVVDVPLGNPEDVTLRALRALREASLVVARDIPRVREFLTRNGIDAPLAGYNESESRDVEEIALEALESGDVALLSETTPLVYHLVRSAVERGLPVVSVPGPSAAVTALVLSGLPADAFVCLGFLPQRAAERRTLLASLAAEPRTMVAFEMSSRLAAALHDVAETLGDRPMALTQVEGRGKGGVWRGTVKEALAYFEANLPDGQCALVIGGAMEEERRWPEARVRSELARLLAEGLSRKAAARQVAQVSGWRQREVYRLAEEQIARDCGA